MKILSICKDDYANFAYENSIALQKVGVDCRLIKRFAHAFSYERQGEVMDWHLMIPHIEEADVIQIFHSCTKSLELVNRVAKGKKRIIVYHTGSNYRRDPNGMNEIFNPHVEFCMTDQCEFMHLGAKKLSYIATAVDTERLIPCERKPMVPYLVAHYPSNPTVKGSAEINDVMSMLMHRNLGGRYRYHYSTKRVDHSRQIKRMLDCDIYIELYAMKQNGNQYGCYGVTAFEAAAMGKVVVTMNVFPNVYTEAYGCELPFVLVYSYRDFMAKLSDVIMETNVKVHELQQKTREWLVQNHSYEATGRYLKKIILQ